MPDRIVSTFVRSKAGGPWSFACQGTREQCSRHVRRCYSRGDFEGVMVPGGSAFAAYQMTPDCCGWRKVDEAPSRAALVAQVGATFGLYGGWLSQPLDEPPPGAPYFAATGGKALLSPLAQWHPATPQPPPPPTAAEVATRAPAPAAPAAAGASPLAHALANAGGRQYQRQGGPQVYEHQGQQWTGARMPDGRTVITFQPAGPRRYERGALAPLPAADFSRPELWTVRRGVPVFKEHAEEGVHFDRQRLRLVAEASNARGRRGDHCPIIVGHVKPGMRETDLGPLVGYARDFRPGALEDGTPAVVCDWWLYPDREHLTREYPRVSVELWSDSNEIDPVCLLKRTPRLDLGTLAFSRGAGKYRHTCG